MQIIPLTAEHVLSVWGKLPPTACTGIAVVEGDQLMGIGAVYPDEANQRMVLFSHIADTGRQLLKNGHQRKVLMTACRAAMKIAQKWKVPVHAVADPAIPGSRNLLKHLKFTHYREDTYAWQPSL